MNVQQAPLSELIRTIDLCITELRRRERSYTILPVLMEFGEFEEVKEGKK